MIGLSEQLQGCFLDDASNSPIVEVSFEYYGVVERDCDVKQLAIGEVKVSIPIAI